MPEDGSKDVFVHATNCKEKIKDDDNVTFDVREGQKGLEAHNVELA